MAVYSAPGGRGSESGWLPFREHTLGWMDSYAIEKRRILQGFSRSTRFTILCTAQISKFQQKIVQNFGGMNKFHFISFRFFLMSLAIFCKNHEKIAKINDAKGCKFEFGAVRRNANLVDLENPENMRLLSLSEVSIQPITSPLKFLKNRGVRMRVSGGMCSPSFCHHRGIIGISIACSNRRITLIWSAI